MGSSPSSRLFGAVRISPGLDLLTRCGQVEAPALPARGGGAALAGRRSQRRLMLLRASARLGLRGLNFRSKYLDG